jgi:hypothetical protein
LGAVPTHLEREHLGRGEHDERDVATEGLRHSCGVQHVSWNTSTHSALRSMLTAHHLYDLCFFSPVPFPPPSLLPPFP